MTMAEATTARPCIFYAVCVNDKNRPENHVGDWPVEGDIYPVCVVESKMEGMALVHVLGFQGDAPYYNAFSPERFDMCAAHIIPHLMNPENTPVLPIFLN